MGFRSVGGQQKVLAVSTQALDLTKGHPGLSLSDPMILPLLIPRK